MKIAEVNDDVYITMLAENITEVSDDNVIESNDPEINAATTVIADEVRFVDVLVKHMLRSNAVVN